jgi:hypothetical protein
MTRLRYAFDEARVQRFIREGRGQGAGRSYRPWLQIQDVPSLGRSHRPYGIKSKRVHHLLSDGEWKCFLKLEGDAGVQEIREQFPMDRLTTFRLAQKLGVRHPRTMDGTPYVMTLDFLVTVSGADGAMLVPYTFKYDPETLSPREQELMVITRAFWREHGVELQLIDQAFFDERFNQNYHSVRGYHDISQLSFYDKVDVAGVSHALLEAVVQRSDDTLLQMCRWLAPTFDTTPLVAFQVAMHMVSRGTLRVDLGSSVGLERLPLSAYSTATIPVSWQVAA